MSVVVYTTPTCGFCHQVKAYLHQRGVPFTECNVSRDGQAATEMVRLSGQQGVPVVLIDGQVVVGFNRPLIDQQLAQRATRPPRLGVAIAALLRHRPTLAGSRRRRGYSCRRGPTWAGWTPVQRQHWPGCNQEM